MAFIRYLIIVVVSALALVSCGVVSLPASRPAQPEFVPMPTAAPAAGVPALESGGGAAPDQQAPSQDIPASDRLIVKSASISVEVANVSEAEAAIRQLAARLDGFVVSTETYGTGDEMRSTIVFRVPAARFEEALGGVELLARKMLSRSISGEDVTEEYVDLEARLRNLEATRNRLLDMLQRAEKVEDALSVNQALSDVQEQIEQIKGRMQYLQRSAAMSTITAELNPVPPPPTIIEEDGWQPINVAREALRGLLEFGQGLVNLLIVLVIWTPVWLPVVLFGRWSWRKITRGGKKPEQPMLPATPPSAPMPQSGGETGSGASQ